MASFVQLCRSLPGIKIVVKFMLVGFEICTLYKTKILQSFVLFKVEKRKNKKTENITEIKPLLLGVIQN